MFFTITFKIELSCLKPNLFKMHGIVLLCYYNCRYGSVYNCSDKCSGSLGPLFVYRMFD